MKLLTLLAAAAAQLKGRNMKTLLIAVLSVFAFAATATADVSLRWEPHSSLVHSGELMVVTVSAQHFGDPQPFDAVDLVLSWHPGQLEFSAIISTGPVAWTYAGYPAGTDDPDGRNLTHDDGTLFFKLVADETLLASSAGVPLITAQFRVLSEPFISRIRLDEYGGDVRSAVYHEAANVTDNVGNTSVNVAAGGVRLEWRESDIHVGVGEPFEVGLYAVSADGVDHPFPRAHVVFLWDASLVDYVGVDTEGHPWHFAGFPDDGGVDGWNDSQADGDAWLLLVAWPRPCYGDVPPVVSDLPVATADGLLIATFKFVATGPGQSELGILYYGLQHWTRSAVFDDVARDVNILAGFNRAAINAGSRSHRQLLPAGKP